MTLKNSKEQSLTQSRTCEHSTMLAQLELFIKLGNMLELDPNKHFKGILNLGNAMIEGDMALLQQSLSFYVDHTDLLFEHISFLKCAFAHAGVSFQEPAVLKYEGPLGKIKTAIVISIVLERAGKIAYISSDSTLSSFVQGSTRNKSGIMTMEPLNDDPQLLLRQISRVIRQPDVVGPPPFSTAASCSR